MKNINILYRNLILKYYHMNNNKNLSIDKSYLQIEYLNDFCDDDHIILQVQIIKDIIFDFRIKVEGCVICVASANFMIAELTNKDVSEALKVIDVFNKILNGEKIDCNILKDDFKIFQFISQIKSRISCAFLSWKALLHLLKKYIHQTKMN